MRRSTWVLGATTLGLLLLLIAEIAAIIWVSSEIGWWTLLLMVASTVAGIYLMQREWRKAWGSMSEAIRAGQLPSGRVADTTMVLAGGILLVAPGLLTDVAGLLLLMPFTRPFVRSALAWWAARVLQPPRHDSRIIKGDLGDQGETLIPGLGWSTQNEAAPDVIRGDLDDDPEDRQ